MALPASQPLSLLPDLEHPIGTALRHVVQCSLNGAPILALIRRQPKIRLDVGNVHNLIGGSSAHLVTIASIVRDGDGRPARFTARPIAAAASRPIAAPD
jgi:hypothetical protein